MVSGKRQRRLIGRHLTKARHIIRQQQPLCAHCELEGKLNAWDELDHIVPLYKGGTDDRSNLQGLCRTHHKAKTATDMRPNGIGCDAQGNPVDAHHHWHSG